MLEVFSVVPAVSVVPVAPASVVPDVADVLDESDSFDAFEAASAASEAEPLPSELPVLSLSADSPLSFPVLASEEEPVTLIVSFAGSGTFDVVSGAGTFIEATSSPDAGFLFEQERPRSSTAKTKTAMKPPRAQQSFH